MDATRVHDYNPNTSHHKCRFLVGAIQWRVMHLSPNEMHHVLQDAGLAALEFSKFSLLQQTEAKRGGVKGLGLCALAP